MSANMRYVLVDDRDGGIDYAGSWSPIDGNSWNSRGEFGTTYLNTLRSTSASSSSFSFTFDGAIRLLSLLHNAHRPFEQELTCLPIHPGDAARVMGTSAIRNAKTNPDPTWECYLDGVARGKESYFDGTENNWAFCKFFDLSPGQHTIRVDVKSTGTPFFLDQIQYKPTTRVDDRVMMIHYSDPDLVYEGTWNEVTKTARYAPAHGCAVTFSFIGNKISVYGIYMNQLPHEDSPASYQIDNEPPVSFTIKGGGSSSAWNRLIFETPRLSQGRHTIKITNQGGTNTTPLVFGFARVEGGTTQLVGTTLLDGGSDGDTPSGGGSTDATTRGASTTTTASASPMTVTMLSDSDLDFDPGVDNVSDLVSKPMSTTTGTAKEGKVTVVYIPASDVAAPPMDQTPSSGSGSNVDDGTGAAQRKEAFPIAGVVGIVLGLLLILALAGMFLLWRRSRRKRVSRLPGNVHPFGVGATRGLAEDRDCSSAPSAGIAMAQTHHDGAPSLPAGSSALSASRYAPSLDNDGGNSAASSRTNLLQPVRKNQVGSSNISSEGTYSSHEASSSQLVLHEDSGLRLPPGLPVPGVEDVPPSYTPR